MPRFIRVWEKKRGHRRTGSKFIGGLGELLFFGFLFLVGVLLLTALLLSRVLESPSLVEFDSPLAFWWILLVLLSFIVLGGSGTFYAWFHVGTSAERRASLASRAADIELIREALPSPREYPTVPGDANLTNSPGITLKYRLPIVRSSAWRLTAAAAFAVAWNVIAVTLTALAAQSHLRGRPDMFLTLFVIPFLLIGAGAVYFVVRKLLVHSGLGPTSVEISDHPLLPGQEYEVFVTQAGNIALKRLRLSLVCQEEATFSQGTDVRTETQVVYRQEVFRQEDFRIEPARPFEHQCRFRVPPRTMHSFQTGHNAIHWQLVVQGKPRRWQSFERRFPVVVYPGAAEMDAAEMGAAEMDAAEMDDS